MNAIDIVTSRDVTYDLHHMIVNRRLTRILPQLRAIHARKITPTLEQVQRGQVGRVSGIARPKRINPRMQFESTLVCLDNRVLKWIVSGISALRTLQQRRPGFE